MTIASICLVDLFINSALATRTRPALFSCLHTSNQPNDQPTSQPTVQLAIYHVPGSRATPPKLPPTQHVVTKPIYGKCN